MDGILFRGEKRLILLNTGFLNKEVEIRIISEFMDWEEIKLSLEELEILISALNVIYLNKEKNNKTKTNMNFKREKENK